MRRIHADANSQPVRNLFNNPSCETGGAVINVRTNLLDYPNFEAPGVTVDLRTNHCVNPRGVNAFAGYGSQTITANVSITGNPDGITTANRVSYVGGAANPGVILANPVTAGAVYTISAWVYHETIPASGSQGFAQAGVTSQPSPPAIVQGTWQRQSWVAYTTSGTSQIGFRVSGQAEAGSFLITGVLVELTGYLATFFDGATASAGSITYAWDGTANNSASKQRSPVVAGWSARWYGATGGAGVSWQSGSVAAGGTYFFRKLWKYANTGPAADTGVGTINKFPVTAGTTYTASASTRCSIAGQHNSLFFGWYDAGNNSLGNSSYTDAVTMTNANTWYRSSYSAVAPANAVTAALVVGPYMNALPMPAGATWDCDLAMVEAVPTLSDYFDGSTAAAGDFTYAWTGASNASTSQQRATGFGGSFTTGNASSLVQSSDWSASGSKSCRIAVNFSTNTTDTFATASPGQLPAGTYTIMATCRVATVQTGTIDSRARRIQTYHSGTATASPQAPNAVGVYPLRVTIKITDGGVYQSFRLYNGASSGNGDIWWDNIMIVAGEYTGDYIDGTKPLSKWDGAANASTSVGYPPQLFDIAGKPSLDLVGVGSSPSSTLADPFAARTVYFCYEIVGTTASWVQFGSYGHPNTEGFNLQGNTAGSISMAPRWDFPGGDTNSTFGLSTGRTNRIHVFAASLSQGLTQSNYCFDGNADATKVIASAGTGLSFHRITGGSHADGKVVRALVYMGEHDRATRLAISRYLGNKYGANVI